MVSELSSHSVSNNPATTHSATIHSATTQSATTHSPEEKEGESDAMTEGESDAMTDPTEGESGREERESENEHENRF